MDISPKTYFPELTLARKYLAEWTFSRKPIFQNEIILSRKSFLRAYILRKIIKMFIFLFSIHFFYFQNLIKACYLVFDDDIKSCASFLILQHRDLITISHSRARFRTFNLFLRSIVGDISAILYW